MSDATEVFFNEAAKRLPATNFTGLSISFSDLAENFPEDRIPCLDRANIDESVLSPRQQQWRQNGYVVVPRLIPSAVVSPSEHTY
jgi:hypothetical protein